MMTIIIGWKVNGVIYPPNKPPGEIIELFIHLIEAIIFEGGQRLAVEQGRNSNELTLEEKERLVDLGLGYRIRLLRMNRGISQRHILNQLGKYGSWLSQVENGSVELYAKDIKPLAEALGVKVSDLIN